MNNQLTEVVMIVDRSGSMADKTQATIESFNKFIEAQRLLPGEANLTLVLFNAEYKRLFNRVPLAAVPQLTTEDYLAGGSTALLDAIGSTVDSLGIVLKETPEAERPAKVIVAILTDGLENASFHYSRHQIAQMIQQQQDVYKWQFVFLGADLRSLRDAQELNIPAANVTHFADNAIGTRTAMESINLSVTQARATHDSAA